MQLPLLRPLVEPVMDCYAHKAALRAIVASALISACPFSAAAGTPTTSLDGSEQGSIDSQRGEIRAVAGIGDFDGDGLDDVAVEAAEPGRAGARAAYVVFGQRERLSVDLAKRSRAAVRITGFELAYELEVAGAGDFNGDGLADLVIGAKREHPRGRARAGSAFVVFGSRKRRDLDVRRLGRRGLRIDGREAGDRLGSSVDGVQDLDRDGRAEVVLGAPGVARGERFAGAAYLVFGSRAPGRIRVGRAGAPQTTTIRGFVGSGSRKEEDSPWSARFGSQTGMDVDAVGDVNADGFVDLAVASPGGNSWFGPDHPGRRGRVSVVFGARRMPREIDLRRLRRGYHIVPGRRYEVAGYFDLVAGAGDFDGDGRADVVVGLQQRDHRVLRIAQIVLTHREGRTVRLGRPHVRSVPINGWGSFKSFASVGDLNRDKSDDLFIGEFAVHYAGDSLVFGRRSTQTIDLRDWSAPVTFSAYEGGPVAFGGDVNGDGESDLLAVDVGTAFVIYGPVQEAGT